MRNILTVLLVIFAGIYGLPAGGGWVNTDGFEQMGEQMANLCENSCTKGTIQKTAKEKQDDGTNKDIIYTCVDSENPKDKKYCYRDNEEKYKNAYEVMYVVRCNMVMGSDDCDWGGLADIDTNKDAPIVCKSGYYYIGKPGEFGSSGTTGNISTCKECPHWYYDDDSSPSVASPVGAISVQGCYIIQKTGNKTENKCTDGYTEYNDQCYKNVSDYNNSKYIGDYIIVNDCYHN